MTRVHAPVYATAELPSWTRVVVTVGNVAHAPTLPAPSVARTRKPYVVPSATVVVTDVVPALGSAKAVQGPVPTRRSSR